MYHFSKVVWSQPEMSWLTLSSGKPQSPTLWRRLPCFPTSEQKSGWNSRRGGKGREVPLMCCNKQLHPHLIFLFYGAFPFISPLLGTLFTYLFYPKCRVQAHTGLHDCLSLLLDIPLNLKCLLCGLLPQHLHPYAHGQVHLELNETNGP